jgi:hypothetical protein
MAAQRTVVQSLSIALIIFVMLTFILAVTTYLGFKGKLDADTQAKAANEKATKAAEDLATQRASNDLLVNAIGIAMTDPADPSQINPEKAIDNWFAERFSDFKGDPRSYEQLALWLKESIREKDSQLQERLIEKERDVAEAEKQRDDANTRAESFSQQVKKVEEEVEARKQEYDASVKKHQADMDQLSQDYKKALDDANQLQEIELAVARAEDVVSARSLDSFKSKSTVDRVDIILTELRERERAINRYNALLAKLRVADPALQRTVADSIPLDDRIDGFDGRVIAVNQADRTALILCDSTRGMRPGLVLYVYGPDDPKPLVAARKATVEVMDLESPTLARVRIRRDSIGDPIVSGDGVATSLWAAGTQFTTVMVGHVQIDQDPEADAERLQELIEGIGGTVETSVTPLTTMLIDAGEPQTFGLEKPKDWREKDEKRRERELREARRLGVQVIGLGEFMQTLGLRRDSLDANRVPEAAAAK